MPVSVTIRAVLAVGVILLGLVLPLPTEANLREKVEELAAQVIRGVPEGRSLRVAVTDLPDLQGVTSDFGRFVAERITTRLAQAGRFTVIERRRLTQVLGELKFGMGDLVDPAKAKRLGQMLGVDALLVGSVSDLGNQVDVDVRLIDIETNRMLLGASATITKDQVVANLLASGRQASGPAVGPSAPAAPGAAVAGPLAAGAAVSAGGFVFQPRGCRRSGGELVCTVTFTNSGNEERALYLNGQGFTPESRVIDDRNNQHPVSRVTVGGKSSAYVHEKFFPQLPVNVHFTTKDVREDVASVTLVLGVGGFDRSPVLRDIPVGTR